MLQFQRLILALVCAFLFVMPGLAQEDDITALRRDPQALAQRLLGADMTQGLPAMPTAYQIGDTTDFWIGKNGSDTPTHITAELVAATPHIYIWVEQGLGIEQGVSQRFAAGIDRLYSGLRARSTFSNFSSIPGGGDAVIDPANMFPVPDIDNDPHLYIVYTGDIGDERDAIHNPLDSQPAVWSPGGYSNEHEMLVVNTTAYPGLKVDDDAYTAVLTRGIYNFITDANRPEQAIWLREGLSLFLWFQLQQQSVGAGDVAPFLNQPSTPLLLGASLTTRPQVQAGQMMFLTYLNQRYGSSMVLDLFLQDGEGIAPLEAALETEEITDPATGASVNAADAFGDFVLANGSNALVGDGRYFYSDIQLQDGQMAAAIEPEDPTDISLTNQPVSQFGTSYIRFTSPEDASLDIEFFGSEHTARLQMPADMPSNNHFYWSGSGQDRDHTLTRAFDLSNVDTATLTFDVWYDFAESWNYGYVEASADGGATWDILPSTSSSANNQYGVAYGAGFTGISNPRGARPFPVMGVLMQSDGMTINSIDPAGPAAQTDLQPNDIVVGYDGHVWQGPPNVLAMLANYAPGDTITLMIQRGREQFEIPVVLGAHPSRVLLPEPLWIAQEVDLTPYAGKEILVRFEYVSVPNRFSSGFAVDNIALPEIEYNDDAESGGGWESTGWQRTDNRVDQQYLVQVAALGTDQSPAHVERLLSPGDGNSGGLFVEVKSGETVLITVSGMNDDSFQPAQYSLTVR